MMSALRHKLLFLTLFFFSSICHSEQADRTKTEIWAFQHIESVLNVLDKNYVYPDTAALMREAVAAKRKANKYSNIESLEDLLKQLQSDLRETSNDGHLSLHLVENQDTPLSQVIPSSVDNRRVITSLETVGQSAKKIGFMRFNKFSGSEQLKLDVIESMAELSIADCIVIDLRENRGGSPQLAAFLISYFVDPDIPLWSVLDRDENTIMQARSAKELAPSATQFTGALYILTSQKTYSAAEAFTYALKHLDRATVVGENTGGGAHLVEMMRVSDEINIRIPTARAHNPITQSNWERVGVAPDIEVNYRNAKTAAMEDFLITSSLLLH